MPEFNLNRPRGSRNEYPLANESTPSEISNFLFSHEGQNFTFNEHTDYHTHFDPSTYKRSVGHIESGESASKRREVGQLPHLEPKEPADDMDIDGKCTPPHTATTSQDEGSTSEIFSRRNAHVEPLDLSYDVNRQIALATNVSTPGNAFHEPSLLSPTASPRSPFIAQNFREITSRSESDSSLHNHELLDINVPPISARANPPSLSTPYLPIPHFTHNITNSYQQGIDGTTRNNMINVVENYSKIPSSLQKYVLFQALKKSSRNTLSSMYSLIENALAFDILSELPKEVQSMVLGHLDINSIVNASEVSKSWYQAIDSDDNLWKTLLQNYNFEPTNEEYNRAVNENWGYTGWATPTHHSPTPLKNAFGTDVNVYKALFRRLSIIHQNWVRKDVEPRRFEIQCPEKEVITCLNFDEDYIIACTEGKHLNVYDTQTGELLHEFNNHEGGVWALKRVGKDTIVSGSIDHTVRVWSLSKKRCTHVFRGHHATVRCLDVIMPIPGESAYDFPVILTGSRDTTLRMWRLPSYSDPDYDSKTAFNDDDNPYFMADLRGHFESVRAVSGYGDVAISGSYDYRVRVWDLAQKKCRHVLEGHEHKVYAAIIDPQRNRGISASMDNHIKIWDLEAGSLLYTLEGHTGLVGLLGLKDNILVSAAADKSLRVWDPETGAARFTLTGHDTAILCFDHDGRRVVSGSERHLKLWDSQTGEFQRDLLVNIEHIWQVCFNRRKCVAAVARGRCSYLEVLDFDFDPNEESRIQEIE